MPKPNRLLKIAKTGLQSGVLLLLLVALIPSKAVSAQDTPPDSAYYEIQSGDSLWEVAARFGLSLEDLEKANDISNPDQISAGTRLVIPGLEGITGRLDTQTVPFGENLLSLSRRYQISPTLLIRLNHLTSPSDLYAGSSVILPADQQSVTSGNRSLLGQNQSILEMAITANANPWDLLNQNELPASWAALPGDVIAAPGSGKDGPGALPESITSASLEPVNLAQGKTAVLKMAGPPGLTLTGSLAGNDLHFFADGAGYVALQGIHALTEPGIYPLTIEGADSQSSSNGQNFKFTQAVLIRSGNYPFDPNLQVDPKTVDPAVTKPEDELWKSLGTAFTPEKMWDGLFKSPVPDQFKDCWPSLFGNRRAYNGGAYIYFHSGLDFCGRVGTELYAPAAGKVVYTGSLVVRGNVTVIDHGWGVYTAYDHQSQIQVKPGDLVQPGQVIGLGGETGRTTGPHLHFEVWVGGVQVDPQDWLKKSYP